MPLGLSLKVLHDVIQAAFRWAGSHLYEFRIIGERRYGIPDPDFNDGTRQAKSIKLSALVAKGIDRFEYVYDFGDDWKHDVVVEASAVGEPDVDYPRFVAGARRAPPDDVGGPFGFFDFLQAVADPQHPEHRRMVEWYGGPYDPDDLDLPGIKEGLAAIVKRRSDGRLGYAKSQALGLKSRRGGA